MASDDAASAEETLRHHGERSPTERLSSETVRALYAAHSVELLAFLIGVLRNVNDANEVSQVTFRRLIEDGHTANEATIKGWLFKVALREALIYRRSAARSERNLKKYSGQRGDFPLFESDADCLVQSEEVSRLRHLLVQLPIDQQHVVRQRIYEDKTFAAIAEELNVPVGTVLTRMRLALEKLRKWFENE